MEPDVHCTSRDKAGHASSSGSDTVERPSTDDDLRWFSANNEDHEDDRTSVGDDTDVVSTDDNDDVCTLTPDDDDDDDVDDDDTPKAKRESDTRNDHAGSDASAKDGNERCSIEDDDGCRSVNDNPPRRPTKDESKCDRTHEDLEGQQQPRKPPDGGARAWLVALGAFAALVCTFGYLNTFG